MSQPWILPDGCAGEFDGVILEDAETITFSFQNLLEGLNTRLDF